MSNKNHDKDVHDHPGFDPDHLIEMEKRRRALLSPEEVLGRSLPGGEATMLDLGCGAGFSPIETTTFPKRREGIYVVRAQPPAR